jgi:Ion channel
VERNRLGRELGDLGRVVGGLDDDDVGYGDVFPETDSGRVLAIVLMIVGIGFVAVLTGAIAERFVAGQVRAEVQQRDANEEDVLSELREIMARLQRLETRVQSGGQGAPESDKACVSPSPLLPTRATILLTAC